MDGRVGRVDNRGVGGGEGRKERGGGGKGAGAYHRTNHGTVVFAFLSSFPAPVWAVSVLNFAWSSQLPVPLLVSYCVQSYNVRVLVSVPLH